MTSIAAACSIKKQVGQLLPKIYYIPGNFSKRTILLNLIHMLWMNPVSWNSTYGESHKANFPKESFKVPLYNWVCPSTYEFVKYWIIWAVYPTNKSTANLASSSLSHEVISKIPKGTLISTAILNWTVLHFQMAHYTEIIMKEPFI